MDGTGNKLRILKATVQLAKDKGFDNVSVVEICKEASVSKQTFYRLFADKYDIAVWYTQCCTEGTCRLIGTRTGWRDGYAAFARIVSLRSNIHKSLASKKDFNSVLNTSVRTSIDDAIKVYRLRHNSDPDDLLFFQIKYFFTIASYSMHDWIQQENAQNPDRYVEKILSMIPSELYKALNMNDSEEGFLTADELCQHVELI